MLNGKKSERGLAVGVPHETAKRRQILDGARIAFMENGFDGTSMGDVVAASSVSKATLYAYFESKEKLFETLISELKRSQAEQLFDLNATDHDVTTTLTNLGLSFMDFMMRAETVQFTRVVIAASAKFPQIGRAFYEAGPEYGKKRLAGYLAAQVEAGILVIEDVELAAGQFLDLCKSGITIPMLLDVLLTDDPSRRERTVGQAVTVFLAAYKPPAAEVIMR